MRAGGVTNMAEAFILARTRLAEHTCHREIMLVTDGMPNNDGDPALTIVEAMKARLNGIIINAIGTEDVNESFLNKLTESNGNTSIVQR
jgi:uncharacterized protein YegL